MDISGAIGGIDTSKKDSFGNLWGFFCLIIKVNGLSQKKSKHRELSIYFSEKNAGILEFAALPFKILEKKNKLSPFEILQNRAFITNGDLITITPA